MYHYNINNDYRCGIIFLHLVFRHQNIYLFLICDGPAYTGISAQLTHVKDIVLFLLEQKLKSFPQACKAVQADSYVFTMVIMAP